MRKLLLCVWVVVFALPAHAANVGKPLSNESFTLLKAFYDYDASAPLEARVVLLKERSDCIERKVVFRSSRGFLVPGYFEVPRRGKPPYPCVLLMHGWSGSKDNWWEDGNYISGGEMADALLGAGYAVLALDASAHGERQAENGYAVVNTYNEPGDPPHKNYFTLREIVTQTVIDYRRGIDYLATRPEVDMSRIGALGYSMGGFDVWALMAVEPRVKAAVSVVAPVVWSADPVLATGSYARGIGNRPFLVLNGRKDPLCDEASAWQLYRLVEGPNTKLVLYDSDHKLPVGYVKDAMRFIEGKL